MTVRLRPSAFKFFLYNQHFRVLSLLPSFFALITLLELFPDLLRLGWTSESSAHNSIVFICFR